MHRELVLQGWDGTRWGSGYIYINHGCLVGSLLLVDVGVGILESVGIRLVLAVSWLPLVPVPAAAPPTLPALAGEGLVEELAWCLGDACGDTPFLAAAVVLPADVGVNPFPPPLLDTGVELLEPVFPEVGVELLAWLLTGGFRETGVELLAWAAVVVLGGVMPLGGVLRVKDADLCLSGSGIGLVSLVALCRAGPWAW
jgi:hypothetical protein